MKEFAQLMTADSLESEVERLRAEVARLETRVHQLDELAHQDPLIELPNRRGFLRQLESLIERTRRYGDKSAMLFVDVDGLKMINDSFGHQAGDEALIQVAELLVRGVRHSDCVARIGGDEFGILLEHSDAERAHDTAGRLNDVIAGCEFSLDGDPLPLSVAIGVALICPEDDAEAIMARADEEMYKRKSAA